MSSTKVWKSLNILFKTPLYVLWKIPLVWEVEDQDFKLITNPRQLIWHYLGIYFIVMTGIVASWFVIFRKMFVNEEDNTSAFALALNACMGVLGVFGVFEASLVIQYGEDLFIGIKKLENYTIALESDSSSNSRIDSPVTLKEMMLSVVILFLGVVPFFCPFVMYMECDPFYFFFKATFPSFLLNSRKGRMIVVGLRFIYCFLSCIEVTRIIAFNLIIIEYIFIRCEYCLRLISEMCSESNANNFNFWRRSLSARMYYERLGTILKRHLSIIMSNICGSLMGLSFVFGVLVNFISIQMYAMIPMPLYLVFPGFSLAVILGTSAIIPGCIEANGQSAEILKKWAEGCLKLTGFERKVYRKRVAALEPIRFHLGLKELNMFFVKRNLKATFFRWLSEYTIDAVLSVELDD